MKNNLSVPATWIPPAVDHFGSESKFILLLFLSVFALALADVPAQAQNSPRIQVFGGYSFTAFDTKSLGYSGYSALNGGTLAVAGNLFHGFGGVAEASVSYGSGVNLRDALFGPQFLFPRGNFIFFAHGLFGRARSSVRTGVQPQPLDTQNAIAFGGGVDMNFRNHLAIRLIQADYLHTPLFQQTQNNVRISTGLVYEWGSIRRKPHRAPSIPTP